MFTRGFRLWELLFPGEQQIPGELSPVVVPTFDTLAPRVGECLLSAAMVTAVAGAGSNALVFLTPEKGRIWLPRTLSMSSDTFVGPAAFRVVLGTTLDDADRWGYFSLTNGVNMGTLNMGAGVQADEWFPMSSLLPLLVPRKNVLVAYFEGCVGGEALRADLTYIDCPGELVQL